MKSEYLAFAVQRIDAVEALERWVKLFEDNRIAEMEILVESGTLNVNTAIINGLTPLHIACIQGNIPAIRSLIKHGATLDAKSKVGRTPILEAAFYAHHDCVNLLLQAGANPHPLNEKNIKNLVVG